MAGLVSYASSDEEEEVFVQPPSKAAVQAAGPAPPQQNDTPMGGVAASEQHAEASKEPASESFPASVVQSNPGPQPMVGPLPQNDAPPGPSLPSMEDVTIVDQDGLQAPSSPYSANRALIQNLTLPTVPNLDIPPSPPGSPPVRTSKRFEQFLELKRKGTHFNSKLEHSTALANPSLMDKLMAFVEIEGRSQYETVLPMDLWNPQALPDWASADRLKKTREKLVKEREAEQASGVRGSIDFVPASTPAGASTSNVGGIARGEKRKAGWK